MAQGGQFPLSFDTTFARQRRMSSSRFSVTRFISGMAWPAAFLTSSTPIEQQNQEPH